MENHALRQFANICRYSLSFTNRFSDKDYVEKMCDQTPKTIAINSKKVESTTGEQSQMSLEMSSIFDSSMDITMGNSSLRIL